MSPQYQGWTFFYKGRIPFYAKLALDDCRNGPFTQAHSAKQPLMCRLTESGKETKRHAAKAKEWHKARKAKLEAVERAAEKAWPPISSIRPRILLPRQAEM